MAEGKPSSSQGAMPKTTRVRLDAAAKSKIFARKGYEMSRVGRYEEAAEFFTQAISLDRTDYRCFGNRSYCYSIIGKYDRALEDADVAISMEPRRPKCHFRRGVALSGLERYVEAQESFEKTLELDPSSNEARWQLKEVRVRQIVDMGFARDKALWALEKRNDDVGAAVEALCDPFSSKLDIRTEPSNPGHFRSVWVGNIQPEVTKNMLMGLFRPFGDVRSIRILHDRHCAFINYVDEASAGKAMEQMQDHLLCGASLVIRFPDRKLF